MAQSRLPMTGFRVVLLRGLRWLLSASDSEPRNRAQIVQLSNLCSKIPTPTFKLFLQGAAVLSVALLLAPPAALAHPMGNFSVNHYCKILIGPSDIELDYIIDMAEIPTFQQMQENAAVSKVGDPGLLPFLRHESEILNNGITLRFDGKRLALQTVSRRVIFPPGAGGLPTMKMGFVYTATVPELRDSPALIRYRDDNYPDRTGWKEIVAVNGSGVSLIDASVPAKDHSAELTAYVARHA